MTKYACEKYTMPRNINRHRKIAFSIVLTLIVLVIIEGLSQWTYQVIHDHHYNPKRLRKLTSQSWILGGEETGVPDFMATLVVHPYFGFGVDAVGKAKEGFGFIQKTTPLDSLKHADKLRVLVLGGSVAAQLMQSDPASQKNRSSFLEHALERAFKQSGVELDLWMFHGALPGFKQPQQVMAYAFLLALGAEFDLVLNLDGFNEMTLAMFDAQEKGLHPVYPRGWEIMLGNRLTSQKLRKIAQLLKVREEQASLIERAQSNWLARPTLVGLFLAQKVVANEQRAQALVAEIEQQKQQGELTLEEGGIPFDYSNEKEVYLYLAKLWRRSATMLFSLAEANKAEYLHFFQPNQYLEGSKRLTEQERDKFYLPDEYFGVFYRAAYPYFRQQMHALFESGAWFVDASMVFRDEEETVYIDACCHFNEYGLRILAEFIAKAIAGRSERLMSIKFDR